MANDDKGLPKADRRGSTVLVPLGISLVLIVIAALMLVRDSDDAPSTPSSSGGAITQPAPGQPSTSDK
jgi:hypothetical protein